MKNRYDILEEALKEIRTFLIDTDWPLDVSFEYNDEGVLLYSLRSKQSVGETPQFSQAELLNN